ncbi:MAG TPA: DMT family transporter [Chloroflexota bacterium]|nr:DMT family transporter [Chloroflexota bacterium]
MIGEISGLACAAGWAVISTTMKAVSNGVSPVMVNAVRCAFSTLVLAAIVVATGQIGTLSTLPLSAVAAIVASGVLGQAIGDALFISSMKLIGASRALPISGINPILTMVLAMLALSEQVSLLSAVGTFLVVGGVYFLAFPYGTPKQASRGAGSGDRVGVLMTLAATVAWATSTVVLKAGIQDVNLLVANLVRISGATLFLFSIELFHSRGRVAIGLTPRSIRVLALAGGLNGITGILYLVSLTYTGAAKAAVLSATSPVFALPISVFFLKERINRRILIGTGLCIVGIWMVMCG